MTPPENAAPVAQAPAGLPDYPTLLHALKHAAEVAPDRMSMVCEGRSVTYGEYARAVAGLARLLREKGAMGRRVIVMMFNSIEASVASVGAMAAGAQVVLTNPTYHENELRPVMEDTEPVAIITDDAGAGKVRQLAATFGIAHVVHLGAGGIDIATWTGDESLSLPNDLPQAGDMAAMFFTGGTTGVPKGANHTHSMLIAFCRMLVAVLKYKFDEERMLSVAPMFHIFGHHYTNLLPLYLRALIVIIPRYKPELVLAGFEDYKITVFSGGPAAIYVGLMAHENMDKTDFTHLKYGISGGSACAEQVIRSWQARTGSVFLEGYGMSEGAPITQTPPEGPHKILSVGIAPPGCEIRIVDLERGETVLPTGERGEVCIRGAQMTQSYCNRPEETAQAIRDGWFYTGDIGYLDEDGYLFLVDRKKEMIIVGGYNVYPREIDELLHKHPAVHEAAAVGVPHEFRGEEVKAYVSLHPGQAVTEEELIAYCADNLAKYKVPASIEFLDGLPKTAANKINKLALKARSAKGN